MTTTVTATDKNSALLAARIVAGLIAAMQLTGIVYFMLIAPDEAVWRGPWIDAPIIALLGGGVLLKLTVAVAPGVAEARRIALGFLAVGLSTAANLVKIPAYDEPEGLVFVAIDGVLAVVLWLALRGSARR